MDKNFPFPDYSQVNLPTECERQSYKKVALAYRKLLEFKIEILARDEELIKIQRELEQFNIDMREFRQLAESGHRIVPPNPESIQLERKYLAGIGNAWAIEKWNREGDALVDEIKKAVDQFNRLFILHRPVKFEENRYYEFKEITGKQPVRTIVNTADEYAVAFLNAMGGQIYWGIRNSDRVVVGVPLQYYERDEVKQIVVNKLSGIRPIVASTDYKIETHPVYDDDNTIISDLCIVEVIVPRGNPRELYALPNGAVFIKTDSGKRRLNELEIKAEISKRHSITG